jgi:signal transduction histidine kinase
METILIIEDDELIRENMIELFTNEGYSVLAAENGRVGLQIAMERIPDMIVSDIMMPEMDGFQVYKSIRTEPFLSIIPFIFLSALSDKLNIRLGMGLGADDYITKPFVNSELIEAVRNRIAKSRTARKSMEELKLNLIRSVPHEFLTPLNSVLGFSQLLIDACVENDDLPRADILEFSGYIHSAGKKLLRIIRNYVLFTELTLKMQNQSSESQFSDETAFNIDSFIPDFLFDLAKKENRDSNLEINFENVDLLISTKNLKKILEELLDNAMKFSLPHFKISIKGFQENQFYRVIVEDCGKGMSLDEIQAIEAFVQFDRTMTEQSGLGLGLSIVRKLIDLHQGEFWIESGRGIGTKANIRLPLLEKGKK